MRGTRRRSCHEPLQLSYVTRLIAVVASLVLLAVACSPEPGQPGDTGTPPASPGQTRSPSGTPAADLPDAPTGDDLELAQRYLGFDGDPLSDDVLYATEPVGASRTFWVTDPIPPAIGMVDTTLRHVGEHALWYVADDMSVSDTQIADAARRFDEEVFPQVMETFAPDLELPGPIAIVTAPLNALAGYFSSANALPSAAYRYSNERVGVFMNAGVGTDVYMGTLAHEFQHVLHWLVSPQEETWINEGLAEFAARSLGLPALPFDAYLRQPEVSLADWPEELGTTLPNYAGAALFMGYLAHRTGAGNVHRLLAQEAKGAAGIAAYLDEVAPGTTFEGVFGDWMIANVAGAASGPYAYPRSLGAANVSRIISGPESGEADIHQLGAWYMRVEPGDSPLTFRFDGSTATSVLPVVPHSGEHCWWGNRDDGINSTLTRTLDLTDVDEATLRFWMWHHIEESWDHGYVAVSTDDGATWAALAGRHTRTDDPMSVTLGPAYTGRTERWTPETIDLSPYAGQEIMLRFEYVTDESVNTTGWCVDDIEVPEIGFADNAESPEHDWGAQGFIRLSSRGVQQRFTVRLMEGEGDTAVVSEVSLNGKNNAVFVIEQPTTLAVTAMAPKTSQLGTFTYEITR